MATVTAPRATLSAEERKVILGSSLGTVFEWYDFFIYGSVAAVIAKRFFSGVSPSYGFIFALLGFAAGFIVRPLGAVIFGRLGDLVGRKHTFLLTIAVMGTATFLTGVLPTYETVGVLAPVMLIVLRMVQGLAIGGEYGGAATYVAEHAPKERHLPTAMNRHTRGKRCSSNRTCCQSTCGKTLQRSRSSLLKICPA
ncbi:MFS transporter [Caballeronia sp. LjRoot31]|jgi:MFS family permease|uniref:MFS transporter n=1 Tax=Caballeronia sp. LjRoot31 TaxID=3342324 RepID=UPI003F4F53C0